MKKTILISFVIFVVALLFAPSCFAKEMTYGDITINLPNGYESFGTEEFGKDAPKGLILIARSEDENQQLQIYKTDTPATMTINSLSDCDDATIDNAAYSLFGKEYVKYTTNKGLVFLRTTNANALTGEWTVIYTTIENGNLFTVTYFGSDPFSSVDLINELTIEKTISKSNKGSKLFVIIGVFALIILDAVFVGFIIFSFIKDYQHKKKMMAENVVSQYIKIKRRRF